MEAFSPLRFPFPRWLLLLSRSQKLTTSEAETVTKINLSFSCSIKYSVTTPRKETDILARSMAANRQRVDTQENRAGPRMGSTVSPPWNSKTSGETRPFLVFLHPTTGKECVNHSLLRFPLLENFTLERSLLLRCWGLWEMAAAVFCIKYSCIK